MTPEVSALLCLGATRDSETSVSMESAAQLLKHLETNSLPSSDVLILDYMKTLVLLEDTTSLKRVLGMFPEHCLMPPGMYLPPCVLGEYHWCVHMQSSDVSCHHTRPSVLNPDECRSPSSSHLASGWHIKLCPPQSEPRRSPEDRDCFSQMVLGSLQHRSMAPAL